MRAPRCGRDGGELDGRGTPAWLDKGGSEGRRHYLFSLFTPYP